MAERDICVTCSRPLPERKGPGRAPIYCSNDCRTLGTREQKRAYHAANAERDNSRSRKARADNRAQRAEQDRLYYEKNKSRIRAQQRLKRATRTTEQIQSEKALKKTYYAATHDRAKEAEYRKINRQILRDRQRAARLANLDAVRLRERHNARLWREANRERYQERLKRWASEHPEQSRAVRRRSRMNRRARELKAFIETVDTSVVFQLSQGVCGICLTKIGESEAWHIDHVVPLSKGGLHCYANVQLAHAACNLAKGANPTHCHTARSAA